jgi:endoglucanase
MDARALKQRTTSRRQALLRRQRNRAIVVAVVGIAITIFLLITQITYHSVSSSLGSASGSAVAPHAPPVTVNAQVLTSSHRRERKPRLVSRSELAVAVSGNHLVSAQGEALRLVGVDRSGTEYMCEAGIGIFYGPTNAASIAAMKAWHINSVRLPLNEDCWLGINDLKPAYSGSAYRVAIEAYVAQLNAAGIYVILEVHWNAPGRERARAHQHMLDASHGYTLWHSIASAFKNRPAVLFDLYNEPGNLASTTNEEWGCWAHGCREYAGMDGLVSAVRATGARNVILVAGVGGASIDSEWLRYEPRDPLHQLAATFHVYDDHSACTEESCWNSTLLPIAAQVPVVNDEFGEVRCGEPSSIAWLNRWMSYATAHGFSMLAWTWDAWPEACSKGPVLITNFNGSPTPFGAAVKAFYAHPNLFR